MQEINPKKSNDCECKTECNFRAYGSVKNCAIVCSGNCDAAEEPELEDDVKARVYIITYNLFSCKLSKLSKVLLFENFLLKFQLCDDRQLLPDNS